LGVKRLGREADRSAPSSAEVKECVELYLHSSNTPSWRGAQLKHRDNFTFVGLTGILKLLYFCFIYSCILYKFINPHFTECSMHSESIEYTCSPKPPLCVCVCTFVLPPANQKPSSHQNSCVPTPLLNVNVDPSFRMLCSALSHSEAIYYEFQRFNS
jgi:hypothetical protein